MLDLGQKVGPFGTKWDKSKTFHTSEKRCTEIGSDHVPDLSNLEPNGSNLAPDISSLLPMHCLLRLFFFILKKESA